MGTGIGVDSLLNGDCGMGDKWDSRIADVREIIGVVSGEARDRDGPIEGETAGIICGDMMIVALFGLDVDFLEESEEDLERRSGLSMVMCVGAVSRCSLLASAAGVSRIRRGLALCNSRMNSMKRVRKTHFPKLTATHRKSSVASNESSNNNILRISSPKWRS